MGVFGIDDDSLFEMDGGLLSIYIYGTDFMTETILRAVAAFIDQEHLLPVQGTVIVAVSGGADSLCLLHLFHQLCGQGKRYPGVRLHVAHLNHQLRGEASEQDALAVVRLAQDWQLPYTLGSCDVYALARTEQRGLEDAAREARYRFLREVAQGQPIAIAHHQDDQVETLLLHWLRGGGLGSQVGLQPRQQDILRPLLCLKRADTLAYCNHYHLTPLEDDSNNDLRFQRNRIRHELLPLLEQLNPGIRPTLLRTAEIAEVDYAWVEAQVTAYWPAVVIAMSEHSSSIRRRELLALPLSLQRHLLRRVTAMLSGGQSPLELRHFKLLEQLVLREAGGEALSIDLPGNLRMLLKPEELSFECYALEEPLPELAREEVVLPIPGVQAIPGTSWIAEARWLDEAATEEVRQALRVEDWNKVWRMLPSTRYVVYIDGDRAGETLRVRTRLPGDRIQPLGMQYEKKVQDVLVNRHIPRVERDQLPLFFTEQAEQHCVWLGGVTLDQRVRLTSGTQRIVCLLLKKQSTGEGHYA